MSDPQFVEFAGKKEYKCPKCKAVIRYAKYFGSDGKLLTTDGNEPYFDKDKKPLSNTGWPTNPNTKRMHECKLKDDLGGDANEDKIDEVNYEEGVKRNDLLLTPGTTEVQSSQIGPDPGPQPKELTIDDLSLGNLKGEVLAECAILWKVDEWITNYLKIKLGGEKPHPSRVGLWHKLISERLARSHESG